MYIIVVHYIIIKLDYHYCVTTYVNITYDSYDGVHIIIIIIVLCPMHSIIVSSYQINHCVVLLHHKQFHDSMLLFIFLCFIVLILSYTLISSSI